ncbi:hypothetical protein J7M02_01275 [Candidatus Aerophobetes bacterium]|nr:hypothetical protein [Candidatus Aerophobetes bacterium]
MQIFITANSPGELSGWVRPLIEKLKERTPRIKINLIITPCQYASGMEAKVAKGWPWIDQIIEPKEILKYIFLGKKLFSFNLGEKSCILFLGGDAFYPAVLSKKLKAPAFAYTTKPRWKKYFEKFLVPDEKTKEKFISQGVKQEKIEVVGHLSLDSIKITESKDVTCRRLGISPQKPLLTFLPGSRPVEIQFMLPFFAKVADLIWQNIPSVQFLFALSPFVNQEQVERILKKEGIQIIQRNSFTVVKTKVGTKAGIVKENPHQAMSISQLIITIPGTNNLQIAWMGVPMIVTLPLNKAELIPMDGIIGLISPKILPVAFIKRYLIFKKNKGMKFISPPNIITKKLIVPELRGVLKPQDVAKEALILLKNSKTREKISQELKKIAKQRGAADNIAKIILNI